MKLTLNVFTFPPHCYCRCSYFSFAERCGTVQRKHRRCIQRYLRFSGTVVGVFRVEALCQVQLESGNRPYRRRNAIHASAFVQLHPFCSRVGNAAAQCGTSRGKRLIIGAALNKFLFSLVTQKGIDHPSKLAGKRIGIVNFGGSNELAVALNQRRLDF